MPVFQVHHEDAGCTYKIVLKGETIPPTFTVAELKGHLAKHSTLGPEAQELYSNVRGEDTIYENSMPLVDLSPVEFSSLHVRETDKVYADLKTKDAIDALLTTWDTDLRGVARGGADADSLALEMGQRLERIRKHMKVGADKSNEIKLNQLEAQLTFVKSVADDILPPSVPERPRLDQYRLGLYGLQMHTLRRISALSRAEGSEDEVVLLGQEVKENFEKLVAVPRREAENDVVAQYEARVLHECVATALINVAHSGSNGFS
jgi:hypothetical protein